MAGSGAAAEDSHHLGRLPGLGARPHDTGARISSVACSDTVEQWIGAHRSRCALPGRTPGCVCRRRARRALRCRRLGRRRRGNPCVAHRVAQQRRRDSYALHISIPQDRAGPTGGGEHLRWRNSSQPSRGCLRRQSGRIRVGVGLRGAAGAHRRGCGHYERNATVDLKSAGIRRRARLSDPGGQAGHGSGGTIGCACTDTPNSG